MTDADIIVVGGGIAGVSASLRLARHGVRVLLIESSPRLGGRATSYTDPRTGETIDNCQHVALGCCTNYADFCDRLGVRDAFDWYDTQWWVSEGGHVDVIAPSSLPAPLTGAPALLRAGFLDGDERAEIAAALAWMSVCDRSRHQHRTFADVLASQRQSDGAIRKFWAPIVVSACNCAVDLVCASTAIHVFQDAFLSTAAAAKMGVPRVPLGEIYGPCESIIAEAGGRVMLRTTVESFDGTSVTLTDGRELRASRVVCALPPDRAARSARPYVLEADFRFWNAGAIAHSPIVGVHLAFAQPIMLMPHAVLVGRPTQWLFANRDDPSRIHAVISAADEWMDLHEDEIVRRVVGDIRACFPSASVELRWARAIKTRRATFLPSCVVERLRPDAASPDNTGVILAGDYTQTGWPGTMEGAVRSGYVAAALAAGLPATTWLARDLDPPLAVRAARWIVGTLSKFSPTETVP